LGTLVSLLAAFLITRRRKSNRHHGREREPTPFYSESEPEITHYRSIPSQGSPPLGAVDGQRFSYPQQQSPALVKQRSSRPINPSSAVSIPREYEIEPFRRDGQTRPSTHHSVSGLSDDNSAHPRAQSIHEDTDAQTNATSPTRSGQQEGNSQVYVIHHDSGRAPVSVITSRGTEVVELPPGYSSDYLSAGGSGGAQASGAVQRRQGKSPAGPGGDLGRTP
jgi:hypothetical protein